MGLKIPRLFALFLLPSAGCFQAFPHKCGGEKHFFELRAAVSIALVPSTAGTWRENLVRAGIAGLAGWEVGETQGVTVKHLPVVFLLSLEAGTGGRGGRWQGGWQLGRAGGRLAAVAASRPHAWGGDAQPCVQFPTGLAIRHRRCELPGLTYFPLARRGSGRAADSSPPWGCHPLLCWGAGLGLPALGCEQDSPAPIPVVSGRVAVGGLSGGALPQLGKHQHPRLRLASRS